LYIADFGNNVIRKVTSSGIISTIAGTGRVHGYIGDGGPATDALLNQPRGIAVDGSGNIYIADMGNHTVRKITSSGILIRVAGTIGMANYSGDGGPATAAELSFPEGLALDANGNLYIADEGNNRIRKVTPTGTISTVVGKGTAGYSGDGGAAIAAELSGPADVKVDGDGNLYIADDINNRIRKVTTAGTISTLAGCGLAPYGGDGGAAILAKIFSPSGIAIDANGNVYIADYGNNRIRKVSK